MKKANQEEQSQIDAVVTEARLLFESGYAKTDHDYPGWVRWWSIHEEDAYPPKEVSLSVWYYIRGIMFGIGSKPNQ